MIAPEAVEKMAAFTAKCIDMWIKFFDKYNITITIPFHGFDDRQVSIWWKYIKDYVKVTRSISLGGMALRSHAIVDNIISICRRIRVSIDDIKHVHIFGLSSMRSIAFIHLLETFINKKVTYDSSKYSIVLRVSKLHLPTSMNMYIRIGRKGLSKNSNIKSLTCHCPACMRFFDGKIGEHLSSRLMTSLHHALALHNLWTIIMYIDKVEWLRATNRLEEYIVKNFPHGEDGIKAMKTMLEGGEVVKEFEGGRVKYKFYTSSLKRWFA